MAIALSSVTKAIFIKKFRAASYVPERQIMQSTPRPVWRDAPNASEFAASRAEAALLPCAMRAAMRDAARGAAKDVPRKPMRPLAGTIADMSAPGAA